MVLLASLAEFLKSSSVETVFAVVAATGSIAVPIGGLIWWMAKKYYGGAIKSLQAQVKDLSSQRDAANELAKRSEHTAETLQKINHQRSTELQQVQLRVERALTALSQAKAKEVKYLQGGQALLQQRRQLKAERDRLKKQNDALTAEVIGKDEQLKLVRADLDAREILLRRNELRIQRAIKLDGFLWLAKALQKVPKFRPQEERRQSIISVLNLKGGVGKTTLTANLGAALARKGYRVLLIDMDLQGSLTQLLLPLSEANAMGRESKLIPHFLDRASLDLREKLGEYIRPAARWKESGGTLSIVGANDHLGYTELTLTLRWLLKHGTRDNRFLLRKALHLVSMTKRFDVVLIDCPPVVNMSCINALAASDGVLIPTTLDERATPRVPAMLRRVIRSEKFRKHINHDLKVLGVIANRTFRDTLTAAEAAEWERLGKTCQDVLGMPVRRMNRTIPAWNEIRDSLGLADSRAEANRACAIFDELAHELEQELPHESRRLATASS